MDLVNFQVGAKTVALPILNILLTERFDNDLTEIPNENPSFIGIKDFMNLAVPVFNLGKILNNKSTVETNNLLSAQLSEHKNEISQWLSSVNSSVTNGASDAAVAVEQTQFSKWLSSFKCDDEDLMTLLQRITAPMSELLDSSNAADSSAATWQRNFATVSAQIERLFDSAIEQIEVGYKPIIVFTTIDGRTPHVGLLVDKVEDSLHVEEKDIKSLDSVTSMGFQLDPKTKALMKGLVQMEDKNSLIIDPSCLFSEPDAA